MKDPLSFAFRAKNGEYAWKADDVPNAVKLFSQNNLAIIDGNAWLVNKAGNVNELYWFNFEIHEKGEYESWDAYVESTSNEFLISYNQIKNDNSILDEKETDEGVLYFNISFLDEKGYADLSRRVDEIYQQ
ncbi:MAG TPA: hypothetical protein VL728_16935 [Cyclobacteriaceae bacterium]|jgi:hypothetical protein|nr:hypothetical protein [Cyclobacteriaceae bacterium]